MDEKSKKTALLDWTRLLGFDQIRRTARPGAHKLRDARIAKVGIKVGAKTGRKV